jgi:hypothetical protein
MAAVLLPPSSEKRREADRAGTNAECSEFWFPNLASLGADITRTGKITPNNYQNRFTWHGKDNNMGHSHNDVLHYSAILG